MGNHIVKDSPCRIDRVHFPTRRTLPQLSLRSVPVAMVCEKKNLNIGARSPSMESCLSALKENEMVKWGSTIQEENECSDCDVENSSSIVLYGIAGLFGVYRGERDFVENVRNGMSEEGIHVDEGGEEEEEEEEEKEEEVELEEEVEEEEVEEEEEGVEEEEDPDQYWLEKVDLVDISKDEGVFLKLKREASLMLTKVILEEEIEMLARDIEEIDSKR